MDEILTETLHELHQVWVAPNVSCTKCSWAGGKPHLLWQLATPSPASRCLSYSHNMPLSASATHITCNLNAPHLASTLPNVKTSLASAEPLSQHALHLPKASRITQRLQVCKPKQKCSGPQYAMSNILEKISFWSFLRSWFCVTELEQEEDWLLWFSWFGLFWFEIIAFFPRLYLVWRNSKTNLQYWGFDLRSEKSCEIWQMTGWLGGW